MTTIWWCMCCNYIRRQGIMVLPPCCCCLPRSTFHPLHKTFLQFPLKQIWCILGQKLFLHLNAQSLEHKAEIPNRLVTYALKKWTNTPTMSSLLTLQFSALTTFLHGNSPAATRKCQGNLKPIHLSTVLSLPKTEPHIWDLLYYFAILLSDWNIWLISLTMFKAIS